MAGQARSTKREQNARQTPPLTRKFSNEAANYHECSVFPADSSWGTLPVERACLHCIRRKKTGEINLEFRSRDYNNEQLYARMSRRQCKKSKDILSKAPLIFYLSLANSRLIITRDLLESYIHILYHVRRKWYNCGLVCVVLKYLIKYKVTVFGFCYFFLKYLSFLQDEIIMLCSPSRNSNKKWLMPAEVINHFFADLFSRAS